MTKTPAKIALSASRDIPFNQLVLSQANVRRIRAGVSIEELAEDIARRTLLTSLTVRPVLDAEGADTGMFEIPAGGRRYRALELLVKQKRLARTAPIPCVVRTDGLAEEDSLAENVQRAPLHPLDQFRAFQAMREKGRSEEEIAAAFFVSAHVVKQRLRLASVSPALLEVYAEDGMTLDQLMAFSVSDDHARQAQVWEALQRSYNKEPYNIRRMLTEGAVRASDKRAQYAGEDYLAAGGEIMRDLFETDHGGWLQDPGLLDRLVAEKLERDAEVVRAEGWKWVEVSVDVPYGHTYHLGRIGGEQPPLTKEETAAEAALRAEAEQIEAEYETADQLPEEVDARLAEIETALEAIAERPVAFDPADIARAGAFVSLDGSGRLKIERGYVRPEDEPPAEAPEPAEPAGEEPASAGEAEAQAPAEPEEDDGLRPLSDKLVHELTAFRTLALREAVGADHAAAYLAVLHVLALRLFYPYGFDSCLEVVTKIVTFGGSAPGLADTGLAARLDRRHKAWAEQLPSDPADLWDALVAFDADSREALFAHCVAMTVNAVIEPWNGRSKAIAHADRLAERVSLDVAQAGWAPSVDNFLGRITKARIVEAVREVRGESTARLIEGLKKGDMAEQGETLLAGSNWLPEPLRTPGQVFQVAGDGAGEGGNAPIAETAVAGGEPAIDPGAAETDPHRRPADVVAFAAE
jgi:ParB family chromosome partitioning protein